MLAVALILRAHQCALPHASNSNATRPPVAAPQTQSNRRNQIADS